MAKIFTNEEKPYEEITTTDFAKQDVGGRTNTDDKDEVFDDTPKIINPPPESTISVPLKPLETRQKAERQVEIIGETNIVDLLDNDLTTITLTGAGEETVKDFTIPKKTLLADTGILRMTLYAENSSGNTALFRIYYGDLSSVLWDEGLTGNDNGTLTWYMSNRDDDQSQVAHGYWAVSTPAILYGSFNDRSVNTRAEQTLRITCETAANNNISIKGIYLELLRKKFYD